MNDYSLTFYVKNKIYVYASAMVDDGRMEISTGIKTESGKIEDLDRVKSKKLDKAKLDYERHIGLCQLAEESILKEKCTEIIKCSINGKKIEKKKFIFGELIEKFIAGASAGTIANEEGKKYPASSVNLMGYASKAATYTGIDKIPVSEIEPKHFLEMRSKLMTKRKKSTYNKKETGLSANTIETYNNLLLVMFNAGRKLGWHKNKLEDDFKIARAKGEDVDYAIAYTDAELNKLYKFDFDSNRKEKIRDVFIFGCYTCLRHSDYYLTDYKMSLNNNNILHLRSLKTDKILYIPLHPVALEIYNKYNGNIPKISYDVLRINCKELAQEAGFNEACLFSRIEGGKTMSNHLPKWQLTTPHTMRRSFATNAFIKGMPERMIMKIGGWKTYSAFERYLRLSGTDIAELAMEQPFYKDWNWAQ